MWEIQQLFGFHCRDLAVFQNLKNICLSSTELSLSAWADSWRIKAVSTGEKSLPSSPADWDWKLTQQSVFPLHFLHQASRVPQREKQGDICCYCKQTEELHLTKYWADTKLAKNVTQTISRKDSTSCKHTIVLLSPPKDDIVNRLVNCCLLRLATLKLIRRSL